MTHEPESPEPSGAARRQSPLAMDAEAFRRAGHQLVDVLAESLAAIPNGAVTPGESPSVVRQALGLDGPLPETGSDAGELVAKTARDLFAHSLFNGHPRFFGYITSSPAPIGMLGDFLASALNQNVGAWTLSPAASEVESQTIRWLASFIGYASEAGGVLVSGGNMANLVCFLAARASRTPWNVREEGVSGAGRPPLRIYASAETHTWLQKAADISGIGTAAVVWIPTDAHQRMDVGALDARLDADVQAGCVPLMVVGTAGTVSTGAVDPLAAIAEVCRSRGVWFHVDAAYGGFAAALPGASNDLKALALADSVAVDPHKWLYAPLEVGCAIVRDAAALRHAFSYHPPYYHFGEEATNFVDLGPQNSRGFRALKVWLALRQVGAAGYRAMIAEDMRLAEVLADAVRARPDLEFVTQALSITTFRYVPEDLRSTVGTPDTEQVLDRLNRSLLDRLQRDGDVFVSNAVVAGRYVLRACIVNFHTSQADVEALPAIVARVGRELDGQLGRRA